MGKKHSKQSKKSLREKTIPDEHSSNQGDMRASQLSQNIFQGEESRPEDNATQWDRRASQMSLSLPQGEEPEPSKSVTLLERGVSQPSSTLFQGEELIPRQYATVEDSMGQVPEHMRDTSSRVIVAAIDFGTTFSGLAYAVRHEIERDPDKVYMTATREPTSVLFKPDKTFFKFGKDAEGYMQENPNEEELTEYYFFQHFKMSLYNTENLSMDTMLLDTTEKKQLPAIDVFSSVMSYFKAVLEKRLNLRFISENDSTSDMIYWVLTCPAIWSLKAKQFMREAAEKLISGTAGIDSAHLAIALEPEAGSIFCRSVELNIEKEESKYEFSSLGEGSKYLLLDFGGGTVDITAHQVGHQTGLQELHQASGGDCGGFRVNQEFVRFIEVFIGPDRIKSIKENYPSDWMEMLNNFEVKKCSYKPGSQVIIRLPTSFQDIFKEADVMERVHLSSFRNEVSFTKDKIKLGEEIFTGLFIPSLSEILEHVRPILRKHLDITHMLVVGGLAESSIIIRAIGEKFPNVKVLIPNDPRSAVLKGAIMFGFKPQIIQARVCRYTYGIAKQRLFNKQTDPFEKASLHNGRYYCDDVFDKYVTLGDVVRVGEFQESKEYHPVQDDQVLAHLEFYASTEKDPRFVTDDSCQFIGLMEITLTERTRGKDGTVEVRINFSGTELEIEAVEKRTGKRTRATCNFLG